MEKVKTKYPKLWTIMKPALNGKFIAPSVDIKKIGISNNLIVYLETQKNVKPNPKSVYRNN